MFHLLHQLEAIAPDPRVPVVSPLLTRQPSSAEGRPLVKRTPTNRFRSEPSRAGGELHGRPGDLYRTTETPPSMGRSPAFSPRILCQTPSAEGLHR